MSNGFEGSKIVVIDPDDDLVAEAFFEFSKAVFPGADFRKWRELGFWEPGFRPHSLFRDGRIVSNVSVSMMNVLVGGGVRKAIQIGTVGTLPAWRNKGLARHLMNLVMTAYADQADFFFLFANGTVVDFYPRFGFRRLKETIWRVSPGEPAGWTARALNPSNARDLELLGSMVEARIPSSNLFGCVGSHGIAMWHVLNTFSDGGLVLLEPAISDGSSLEVEPLPSGASGLPIVLAVSREPGKIEVLDAIAPAAANLDQPFAALARFCRASDLEVHFPPDVFGYAFDGTAENQESLFFVSGDFQTGRGEFAFPALGQT